MKNPRWDFFAAVIAGPLSNIMQAAIWAMIMRAVLIYDDTALQTLDGEYTTVGLFLDLAVFVNLALAFFNMLPFGPLDGRWLVGQLLPDKPRLYWYRFNDRFGMIGLFGLIIVSQIIRAQTGYSLIWDTIGPPVEFLYQFFTGVEA